MAELTPNLGLFKYDPTTDGDVSFSAEQALNDNWDILDAAVEQKPTNLKNLEDVNITATQNGQVLSYNEDTKHWENKSLPDGVILYSTTGNNTDGAISQAGTTTALNNKVTKSGDTMTGTLNINRSTGSNFVSMQTGLITFGTTPSSTQTLGFLELKDKNGQWMGKNQMQFPTSGGHKLELSTRGASSGTLSNKYAKISVGFDGNGNMFAQAPSTLNTRTDANDIITRDYLNSSLSNKQDILVSGENIKTINGTSIMGSGNIPINRYNAGVGITIDESTKVISVSDGFVDGRWIGHQIVITSGVSLNGSEPLQYRINLPSNGKYEVMITGSLLTTIGAGNRGVVEFKGNEDTESRYMGSAISMSDAQAGVCAGTIICIVSNVQEGEYNLQIKRNTFFNATLSSWVVGYRRIGGAN